MKRELIIFLVLLILPGGISIAADSVAIAVYDEHLGRVLDPSTDVMYMLDNSSDTIRYQLWISLENDEDLGGMSLGFRLWSPDGVEWRYNPPPFIPETPTDWEPVTVFSGCRLDPHDEVFDMTGLLITTKNIDGLLEDTLLFGGVSLMSSLSTGPMEPMIALHFSIGDVSFAEVKTMCFDSTFVPPAGNWVYTNTVGNTYPPALAPMICIPVIYMEPFDADDEFKATPYTFNLDQNYPNPFNPNTVINYSVERKCHVSIAVFNILGQKVATLVKGEIIPGAYRVEWDGNDDNGHQVASGIYFYKMGTEDYIETRKMVLMR